VELDKKKQLDTGVTGKNLPVFKEYLGTCFLKNAVATYVQFKFDE